MSEFLVSYLNFKFKSKSESSLGKQLYSLSQTAAISFWSRFFWLIVICGKTQHYVIALKVTIFRVSTHYSYFSCDMPG